MSLMDRQSHEAPQIMRAEDVLARMRAGVKDVHEIRMREQAFPVRVLTMDEVAAIRREGMAYQAKLGGDETDRSIFIQKSTLKLASTVTQGGGPLISDPLLKLLSVDEVKYLYEEYIRVMDSVNPQIEMIPQEVFRELVDALKKKTLSAKDCSLLQLRAICSSFVDLILELETRASQQGSSPGGPSAG